MLLCRDEQTFVHNAVEGPRTGATIDLIDLSEDSAVVTDMDHSSLCSSEIFFTSNTSEDISAFLPDCMGSYGDPWVVNTANPESELDHFLLDFCEEISLNSSESSYGESIATSYLSLESSEPILSQHYEGRAMTSCQLYVKKRWICHNIELKANGSSSRATKLGTAGPWANSGFSERPFQPTDFTDFRAVDCVAECAENQ